MNDEWFWTPRLPRGDRVPFEQPLRSGRYGPVFEVSEPHAQTAHATAVSRRVRQVA